jgi:hypothetical protein
VRSSITRSGEDGVAGGDLAHVPGVRGCDEHIEGSVRVHTEAVERAVQWWVRHQGLEPRTR